MNPKVIEFLKDCGVSHARVRGNSMEPVLADGDTVFLEKKTPAISDIVMFEQEKELFIHRVVFKHKGNLYTIGDNSSVPDKPVPFESVIGVVRSNPRKTSRTFISFLKIAWYILKNGFGDLRV